MTDVRLSPSPSRSHDAPVRRARHTRKALLTAGALCAAGALLAGCARDPAPAPAATAAGPSTPTPDPKPVINDGNPRIADSAAGGVHIQYRVYGAGDPLVVLIHGWSCDSNYWQAQVADLKTRYTVATVDLAGHGGSGANRSDWSMAAFGADVAAVVEALKDHPKVVLVGHSMGGPVMVEAARRLGARVVGVIGVDTLKNVGLPSPPAAETEKRLAAFEKDFIGSTRAMVQGSMFTPNSDPVLVRRIVDDMSQAPPEVALPAIRELNAWEAVPAMNALSVPIVAINADLGGATDEARIRKLVPNFRVVTVGGLGHFLMMEDPARVNPILDAQIRALANGTGTPAQAS
ncbi:MAG: alpha/beta hydrolase [Steroidobacteraceae bacterium]|jgi:pimeloyl-ACP methyl ester carboxylesterase|nr:alpha/beta hydrolase [Steroidobacteraceae bacterium]